MEAFLSILWDSFRESLSIALLVVIVMIVVELFNIPSLNARFARIKKRSLAEMALACLLGAIPGCAGGFAVVSLFSEGMLSFGALVGGMIATFGDEALFLFAQDPKTAALLTFALYVLGFVVGLVTNFLVKDSVPICNHNHLPTDIGRDSGNLTFKDKTKDFLVENVWNHVIKEHALKIFLYIFVTLLFLGILTHYVDLDTLLNANSSAKWLLLVISVAVGLIPASGPHLIFVTLFLQGIVPFGVLLANSLSQNGHAGLPLLAMSKKTFVLVKAITFAVALLAGAVCLLAL